MRGNRLADRPENREKIRMNEVSAFAAFMDCMEHTEGSSVLSEYGNIGQSCDRQQRLLKLEHPDGRVEITDSQMRWIMELKP